MRYVSLFTGIGAAGLAVGEHFGATMAAACELDGWCQRVIARHNPGVPIFDDVRTVGAHNLPAFDILEAGTPCQGFSASGRGLGFDDERSGLWSEMIRIAAECEPSIVFVENVPALLAKWRGRVEADFAGIGYGVTWARVSAASVCAPHLRNRVFILAAKGEAHGGVVGEFAAPLRRPGFRRWATPNASDHRDRNAWHTESARKRREAGRQENLSSQVGNRLNCDWFDALQGLPCGYTDADGLPLRDAAVFLMHNPVWPALMTAGMFGDSPQHSWEPPRNYTKPPANREDRIRAAGNCNPPAQYLRALQLFEQGPQQQSLFGMC